MKSILFVALAAASLSACAQSNSPAVAARPGAEAGKPATGSPADARQVPGTPAARAREAIRKVNPQVQVDEVADAPLAGFQEVIVGGQVVYVSNDGRYLLQGALYDVDAKKNLGEASMARVRRELLKSIPAGDRIVFAPAAPKYSVVVFTDVECGYCRKLHSEIAEYNRQGIGVEYVAFPRMGLASEDFRKMEAVWCAADRRKALTDAKNDRKVAAKSCKNPVAMQYSYGQRMGLTGTPMILAADGSQLGGYVPPAQLRQALDKLAGGTAPPVSGQADAAAAQADTGA